MNNYLSGRTALVTGSLQGIGLACAEILAEAGANVALHGLPDEDKRSDSVDRLANLGGGSVEYFGADLRKPEHLNALTEQVSAWKSIDILVNNAGIQRPTSIQDASDETWDEIIAVNLTAPFKLMRALLPKMARREFGRVVSIASVHGLVASVNKAPYVAAKFGLVGLSRTAALEYASIGSSFTGGVTVNCVCPGWTETPLLEPQIEARGRELDAARAHAIASLLNEKQPTLRMSAPREIGALVAWLCNPVAHNITGTAIPIDGGWTAR